MKQNNIIFDIDNFINTGLTLAQYIFLQCIYYKDYINAEAIFEYENLMLADLEDNLYIKETGNEFDTIFPRQKTIDLFTPKGEEDVHQWINEWCNLFPKGVKSGGYYVRTSETDCLKKMLKFIKTRKYNKDIIMKATRNYIERKALENYNYMMVADYFIEKDGRSTLETECLNLNTEETITSINTMI